jgi:hypothetical protein
MTLEADKPDEIPEEMQTPPTDADEKSRGVGICGQRCPFISVPETKHQG